MPGADSSPPSIIIETDVEQDTGFQKNNRMWSENFQHKNGHISRTCTNFVVCWALRK